MTNPDSSIARRRLLVIEDNQSVRRMLRLALSGAGFDVVDVPTGQEALQILEHQPPDLVVLDLSAADASGRQVLEWLRHRDRFGASSLPWVVISAMDHQETVERYGPMDGHFIPKPFDPWELVRTLEGMSDTHRGRRCEP